VEKTGEEEEGAKENLIVQVHPLPMVEEEEEEEEAIGATETAAQCQYLCVYLRYAKHVKRCLHMKHMSKDVFI